MATAKRPKKAASAGRWLLRGTIATVIGLAIGAAGGVATVRTLEPGRANAVDSVQAVLDSLARGKIAAAPAAPATPDVVSPVDTVAPAANDSADVLLPIPDVVGMEEGIARTKLLEAGVSVGDVQFRASTSRVGTVLATLPPAGSLLPIGTPVSMIISDGRTPVDTLAPLLPLRVP